MVGKQRWRRVRLADLASEEVQGWVLGGLDRATGQPEADSPENRPHENPQVERFLKGEHHG